MTTLDALQAAGSAAKDWTNYPQRMRFIGVLFRSRQRDAGLWGAPFTAEQAEQIRFGQVPAGSL